MPDRDPDPRRITREQEMDIQAFVFLWIIPAAILLSAVTIWTYYQ